MIRAIGRSDSFAGSRAAGTFKQDESPRRELAMIGYSRGNSQQRLDFSRSWARPDKLDWLHRTARLQQLQSVRHRSSLNDPDCAYHSVNQVTNNMRMWLEIAAISAENKHAMNGAPAIATRFARLGLAVLIATFAGVPLGAKAQNPTQTLAQDSLFSATPSTGLISPVPATRSDIFGPSNLPMPSGPPAQGPSSGSNSATTTGSIPVVPAGQVALALSARFGKDALPIGGGAARPHIVHVGFGLATAVKPVELRAANVQEEFELPAGGLRIEGKVGDVRIPPGQISFDVYKGSRFKPGDRRPIAEHVATSDVVVVPEGTYYIVSNYGEANSVVRSDIRVQPGKLTDITVTHRAAAITLKLVTDRGGEALANTAWSVLTPGGDVIKESIGAFPRVILAEGEYRAIARNEGKVYERDFKVVTGVDGDVEVLAR